MEAPTPPAMLRKNNAPTAASMPRRRHLTTARRQAQSQWTSPTERLVAIEDRDLERKKLFLLDQLKIVSDIRAEYRIRWSKKFREMTRLLDEAEERSANRPRRVLGRRPSNPVLLLKVPKLPALPRNTSIAASMPRRCHLTTARPQAQSQWASPIERLVAVEDRDLERKKLFLLDQLVSDIKADIMAWPKKLREIEKHIDEIEQMDVTLEAWRWIASEYCLSHHKRCTVCRCWF